MKYGLSKSRYCKGIQCPKILWMDENMPEQADDVVPENIVKTGTYVGEVARGYFGEFGLVEYSKDKAEMAFATKQLMESGAENIAEASFIYDSLYCAVDILHKTDEGWDIVEVKSSTEVSDIYVEDMSFQYYVLVNCGIKIHRVYNLHIDNSYVRDGELNLHKLFTLEDYTEEAVQKYAEVETRVWQIREYIKAETEPEKDIDCCCDKPYECAYKRYCSRHVPENSVFKLARMQTKKKYELYHKGIITYEQILKHSDKINANQKRQVESVVFHKPDEINLDEINAFLQTLTYPVYHLDFETFQQAIPEYDGCRPYEQIPFQYSLHIEYADGTLEHKEFLAKEGTDPRRVLAERMIADIPKDVCVTAYNMSFEKTVLRNLAKTFPDLAEHLTNIHDNIRDLMLPFQKQYYYSSAMQGSYSIKYVLPALWPGDTELDYHNLEGVHNGQEASTAFADLINYSEEERELTRHNLLKYCELDTYAMVKVLKRLKEVAGQ